MARAARQMAVGGMLAALAVVFMSMGALIPLATFCCPFLAMILLLPVLQVCGRRVSWAWYVCVAVLSCLLCPDPEAAAVFVFLGWYPIVRQDLNRISPKPLRFAAKLLLFNGAILLMYAALIWLLQLEAVAQSILEEALWLNLLTLALGNATFLLLDVLLDRLTVIMKLKLKMK